VFQEPVASQTAQSTRFLHVASGHSTTRTIAQAGIPGTLSVWADALHEGAVPGGVDDASLVRIRAEHLAGPDGSREEVAGELQRWRDALDAVNGYEELVLWYEHDLFDQLNLIQVLDRLAGVARGTTRVTLISIGSFPGRPSFRGMGELTAGELASLFGTRQAIDARHYAAAQAAWRAFRSPDPRDLLAVLSTDLSALPFLGPALHRHLEEFPSTTNGLSKSEQHLLQLVAAGHQDVWQLFPMMHDGERCFYVADVSFWRMFGDLAAADPPLIDAAIEAAAGGGLPRGTLTLTAAGRDVLAGRKDRIRLCGIDRWLGGVHVTTQSPWRWDAAMGIVIPSA
jgi:hypothetical protein